MAVKIHERPLVPSTENKDFDPVYLKQWIGENYDPEFHPALYEAVDNIKRVSFAEFLEKLKQCVKPNILERASVLVSERKSNKWVAEIARLYLNFFSPTTKMESLGSEDANDFVAILDKTPVQKWPSNLVLFDDGSFSGQQMTRHVTAIIKKLEANKTKNTSIHVVIPFVTSNAKSLLNSIEHGKYISLKIHSSATIKTVKESLSKKSFESLNKMCGGNLDTGVALTYFDHKIPNSQSFLFAQIARDALPSIKPPYITRKVNTMAHHVSPKHSQAKRYKRTVCSA